MGGEVSLTGNGAAAFQMLIRRHLQEFVQPSVSRVMRVHLGRGLWQQAAGMDVGRGSRMLMCSHECTKQGVIHKWGKTTTTQ